MKGDTDHRRVTNQGQRADQVALHTYGKVFKTKWITLHDTAVDGHDPFNANTLAKAKSGTPFKRPENGVFRPGTGFKEFVFTETGDTNATSTENPIGGWGSLFDLKQSGPGAKEGQLRVFFKGDLADTGLDNITFLSRTPSPLSRTRATCCTARGTRSTPAGRST